MCAKRRKRCCAGCGPDEAAVGGAVGVAELRADWRRAMARGPRARRARALRLSASSWRAENSYEVALAGTGGLRGCHTVAASLVLSDCESTVQRIGNLKIEHCSI